MSEDPAAAFQPAFWAAKRVLAHASATAFARHGVHEGQQYILLRLWDEDGLAPGELAKPLEKDIGREIDKLSERALASLDQSERAALVRYLHSIRDNLA